MYVYTEVPYKNGTQRPIGQLRFICPHELRRRGRCWSWGFKGQEDNTHGDRKANIW